MWGKLLCNYYTIFQQKANLFHLSVGENANRFSVSVERGTPERWGFNVSFVCFLTCGIHNRKGKLQLFVKGDIQIVDFIYMDTRKTQ